MIFHVSWNPNYDENEEGFQDVMPGDIVIKDRDRKDFPYRDENIFEYLISDSYVKFKVRAGLNKREVAGQSPYGIKARDMMRKKLYEVLGGNAIHQVEHLKIGTHHGVLRLPEGLKLKIRKLSTVDNSMAVIEAILPILDVSSFPLKSLSIQLKNPEDPVIKSDILRTSEFLNIENRGFHDNGWTNLVINLPNKKLHLQNQIPLNNIILIIRNWMEHPRVIGTRLSVQAESVNEYLDEIEKEFKAVKRVLPETKCTSFFPCFTIPMTSTSELNIYEDKSPNHEEELEIEVEKPYMIVMAVMPIGTAQPSEDQ